MREGREGGGEEAGGQRGCAGGIVGASQTSRGLKWDGSEGGRRRGRTSVSLELPHIQT